jgi:hypothetical protein
MVLGDRGTKPMSEAVRVRPRSRPEDRANAYFTVLNVAQANGGFAAAAKAQRLLARLGWVVTRSPDRGKGAKT